jgi:Tol biopolymer transport system component
VLEDFVIELDSSGQDGYPTLSSDGLEIFFGSTRVGGSALIHRATRPSAADPFDAPAPVPELMPPAGGQTGDPELSADGRTIYFARDAPGEPGAGDLWAATRDCLR